MIPEILQKSKRKIAAICRKYQISELSLFGSQVRGESTAKSDFDFLVEFKPEARIDYFKYFEIQEKLEEIVHRKVDLVPKDGLKPFAKKIVLSEAEVIYAA
jgi:predicted nucleotidyltransferase